MAESAKRMEIILTYDDYMHFPVDRQRYEILEGELFMTPSPAYRHQNVLCNVSFLLQSHVREKRLGKVLVAPMDVIMNGTTVVQPDILFLKNERMSVITARGVEGPPDLVVEILSPSTMSLDRITKFQVYGKLGVSWYWIVDPEEESLEEYENNNGTFIQRTTAKNNELFRPACFPGFTLELHEIWR